jgi:hypothetical protein
MKWYVWKWRIAYSGVGDGERCASVLDAQGTWIAWPYGFYWLSSRA